MAKQQIEAKATSGATAHRARLDFQWLEQMAQGPLPQGRIDQWARHWGVSTSLLRSLTVTDRHIRMFLLELENENKNGNYIFLKLRDEEFEGFYARHMKVWEAYGIRAPSQPPPREGLACRTYPDVDWTYYYPRAILTSTDPMIQAMRNVQHLMNPRSPSIEGSTCTGTGTSGSKRNQANEAGSPEPVPRRRRWDKKKSGSP